MLFTGYITGWRFGDPPLPGRDGSGGIACTFGTNRGKQRAAELINRSRRVIPPGQCREQRQQKYQ